MKKTLIVLSAVAMLAAVEGCGCCFRRRPKPVVVPAAPACPPAAPCCAPAPSDCCPGGAPAYGAPAYGAPMTYSDPGAVYTPTPTLPADGYGNPAPVPQ